MGVLSRINDIVRSNLNELVEKAENPEKLLKQAILDMEEHLAKARDGLVLTLAAEKQLQKKRTASQQTAERWERRAALALSGGDEELARQALMRRNEQDAKMVQLDEQIQIQREYVGALKHSLAMLQERLAEARMRKNALVARAQTARVRKNSGVAMAGSKKIAGDQTSRAFATFERMEDKVLQLEGQAEAFAELSGSAARPENGPSLEARFADLEQQDDLDEELATLKKKLVVARGKTGQADG